MGRSSSCCLNANCTAPPCPEGSCCYKDLSFSRGDITLLNTDLQYLCEENVTENCCMTKPFSMFNANQPCGLPITCPDEKIITTPKVQSTRRAFAFLRYDGTVFFRGIFGFYLYNPDYQEPLPDSEITLLKSKVQDQVRSFVDIIDIFSNDGSFIGLKADRSIVGIGLNSFGGVVPEGITDVKTVVGSARAFAALKNDGTVATWGPARYGGEIPSAIENLLVDIVEIESTERHFAARNSSGEIFIWGNGAYAYDKFDVNKDGFITTLDAVIVVDRIGKAYYSAGDINRSGQVTALDAIQMNNIIANINNNGIYPSYDSGFTNVKKIYSNKYAFAFLRNDGKVFTWGDDAKGGDTGEAINFLTNIIDIKSNDEGFVAVNGDSQIISWGNIENRVPRNPDEYKVLRIESTDNYFVVIYIHRPNDPNRPSTYFEAGVDHIYRRGYFEDGLSLSPINTELERNLQSLDSYNNELQSVRALGLTTSQKVDRIVQPADNIYDIVRYRHSTVKYPPINDGASTQEQKNARNNIFTKQSYDNPPTNILNSVTFALNTAYIDSATNPLNVYRYGCQEFIDYLTIGTNTHSYFIDDSFSENTWQEFATLPLTSQQAVLNNIKSNSIAQSNIVNFWGPVVDPKPEFQKFVNGAPTSFYKILANSDNFGADPSPASEKSYMDVQHAFFLDGGKYDAIRQRYWTIQGFNRGQPIYDWYYVGQLIDPNRVTLGNVSYDSFVTGDVAAYSFGVPQNRYKAIGRVSKNKKIALRGAKNYASTKKSFCYITSEQEYTPGGIFINQPEVSSYFHHNKSDNYLYKKNFLVTWGRNSDGGNRASNVFYRSLTMYQNYWGIDGFEAYFSPVVQIGNSDRNLSPTVSDDSSGHEHLGDYNCVFSNEVAMGAVIITNHPSRSDYPDAESFYTRFFNSTELRTTNHLQFPKIIHKYNPETTEEFRYDIVLWGGVDTEYKYSYGYEGLPMTDERLINEDFDDLDFITIFGRDMEHIKGDLETNININQNRIYLPTKSISALVWEKNTGNTYTTNNYFFEVQYLSGNSSGSHDTANLAVEYPNEYQQDGAEGEFGMFLNISDSNYKISHEGCHDTFCDQKEL